MRALILGTSNGIIQQGYPKAIKESPFFDVVENISLGASSSLFFATDSIEDAEISYFANSAADLEGKLSIVGLIVEKSSKI